MLMSLKQSENSPEQVRVVSAVLSQFRIT